LNESHLLFIKRCMYDSINQYIDQKDLKEKVIQFIDFQAKKGFPFGELLILHYQMFDGVKTKEIFPIAAALELLILSFDILDDLEDKDSFDQPWTSDPTCSLNIATALPFICFSVIENSIFTNKNKALSLLNRFALKSVQGQHKDLLNICSTEAEYIEMSLEKSGSLTALACTLGTVLAKGQCPIEIETSGKYIGLIGQINNDIKDIKEWDTKNDILNKKYSLPIIYFLNSQDNSASLVQDYYQNKVQQEIIIQNKTEISRKMIETGAIIYTEVIKKVYRNKVMDVLKCLKIDPLYIDQLLKTID